MSVLTLSQSFTALGVNLTSSFFAQGGTSPYTYAVLPGGAGGAINSSSGLYTAPSVVPSDPSMLYDTIEVTDNIGATVQAQILVGTPLLLFCEIIQNEMGLPNGRVYLWDQKIFQPTDSELYIAVAVLSCKPFANTNQFLGDGTAQQSINMYADIQIDIISRGPAARDRKEEVVMALVSDYAEKQQEANSFYIGKLPAGAQFRNLSNPDGAGIPYRFNIDIALQYFVTKTKPVPYIDTFLTPSVTVQP